MSAPVSMPQARSSGSSRLRLEDFRPLQQHQLETERTALVAALRADLAIRREISSTLSLCAVTSPDATILARLATLERTAPPKVASEAKRLLAAFKAGIGAIERVSPLDPQPPRAA